MLHTGNPPGLFTIHTQQVLCVKCIFYAILGLFRYNFLQNPLRGHLLPYEIRFHPEKFKIYCIEKNICLACCAL